LDNQKETNQAEEIVAEGVEEVQFLVTDEIHIENSDWIEIHGTPEQRSTMFADWALYFTEVANPDATVMNTFFKSPYAPLNEVLNTVRPIMGKYGLSIIQMPFASNSGDACVKTIVTHKDGALISFPTATGKATKNDIQGFGSTVSYLRRFIINSIAGVMGEVDDDGNSNSNTSKPKEPNTSKPKEPTKEDLELKVITDEISKIGTENKNNPAMRDEIYKIIAANSDGNKNPNSIKNIKTAKKTLAEIHKLTGKKEAKTNE